MARTLHDAKLGAIGIALSELRLSGLDGLGNISLLEAQPDDGALLHHSVGLGAGAALSIRLALNLTLDGAPHAFDMGVTLTNVTLRLATRSTIDASSLGGLTLGELLHRPACAAAPLLNLSLDASYTGLAIAPHGALLITASADGTAQTSASASAASTPPPASTALTPSAIPPDLARHLLAALTPGVVAVANAHLAATLASQHAACSTHGPAAPPPPPAPPLLPPPPLPPLAAASVPAWVRATFAAAFGALCAAAAVAALCSVARGRIGVGGRIGGDGDGGGGGGGGGRYLQPDACLASQPPVRRLGLRLALPLLLLANGCLFAAANTEVMRTYSPTYRTPLLPVPCTTTNLSDTYSRTQYLLTYLLITPRTAACSVRASR